jgi:crotonobetainyl-CoA:carnitine CoA-transferase CaiB-like acyl-CoA transferase
MAADTLNPPSDEQGPLSGVRVIDWTVWQQGPVAGAMLGDLGADVIKIEEPIHGDGGRSLTAFSGMPTSSYFETNNRNKRSVTIDIKQPAGLAIVHDLVARADVFIHNFRPTVPEKLGLDYDSLRAVNPRLVYGEASAFGSSGPDRAGRGHDLLGMARSGIMMAAHDGPRYLTGGIGDQMGASMLAYGVVAALLARERFGVGQKVESSLFGGMIWLQGFQVAMELAQGSSGKDRGRQAQINPLYNWYRCSDGCWLALATPQSDRHWPELVDVLERPDLGTDERFIDHQRRTENAEACVAILDEIFRTRPRDEWFRRFAARGSVPFGPVHDLSDVVQDRQATANSYVTSYHDPVHGDVRVLGFPIVLSATAPSIRRRAPELGEHTEEILTEVLGLDWGTIGRLRAEKVISG